MHLVPAARADRSVIDDHRVCQAIQGIPEPAVVQRVAQRFALLGDPTRLTLLLCMQAAGPIAVTDLAVATGFNDATVSQALRLLRAHGAVAAARHGRIMRYHLADPALAALLGGTEAETQQR
jgi:ArsR family transcriptional regulator, lead/cadmium/zinc/bismuth-responsive transcriptional repressor